MILEDIDYICEVSVLGNCIWAGSAYTGASSFAGPNHAFADSTGSATGSRTSVMVTTRTMTRNTHFSQHAYGNATAHAYSTTNYLDSSHSVSTSRYRATAITADISGASDFHTHYG